MARTFKHLSFEQKLSLKEMLDGGYPIAEIGTKLGYHRSTIYREIERGSVNGIYDPEYSEEQYQLKQAEKGPEAILDANPELAAHIADLILNQKLSPERIIEHLKAEDKYARIPLSKECIYYNLDKGRIPGVTRKSLRTESSTLFSGGQICIPKWVLEKLNLKDGDILDLTVTDDGKIIYQKKDSQP